MNALRTLFWNREDRRLRAGWRLLVLILATLAASLAAAALAGRASLSGTAARLLYLALAAVALWAVVRWVDRRSLADLGMARGTGWWRDLAIGLATSVLALATMVALSWSLGWLRFDGWLRGTAGTSFWIGLALQLLVYACSVPYEEALCRGSLLRNLEAGFRSPRWSAKAATGLALALSSLLFGLMHAGNPSANVLGFALLVVLGAIFGLAALLRGSLALPIGLHLGWNVALGPLFGFPVSGAGNGASLLAFRDTGPALWSGGAFGPEGGLAAFAAVTAVVLLAAVSHQRLQPARRLA